MKWKKGGNRSLTLPTGRFYMPLLNRSINDHSSCYSCSGASPPAVLTTAELFAQRQTKLEERKETIADLSSRLVEDPEENVCVTVVNS